jgi:hypothetical protein
VRNSWVRGYGLRYPAGVGVSIVKSLKGTVAHCDISGGYYNGIIFGGTKDAGAYSRYELNRVHGNGHEADDGICDFGGIHGSNAGSLQPIWITSNIFHNITAFENGGIGIYLDVSSTGVQVERNLVYDVTASALNWNVNPGVPALPFPYPAGAEPTRILNNVFIANRDNEFGKTKALTGHGNTNSALKWSGYVPCVFERNVIVVDSTRAPSRDGFYGGMPCALSDLPPPQSPHCTSDLADNMWGATLKNNVYFNVTWMSGMYMSSTFPGGCADTALGECTKSGRGRNPFSRGGCSCRSLKQWQAAGADNGSIHTDPGLQGALKLVTSAAALSLGIEPLHELAMAGPDWDLTP